VYTVGQAITLTGSNFGTNAVVLLGGTEVAIYTSRADTQIQFDFPALVAGDYILRVKNVNTGFASNQWIARVELKISSASVASGSKGGHLVTLSGQGFRTDQLP
jgi:IPT/TIG domain